MEKEISKSPVDPDAGLFYKNEHERMFCYNLNTACDKHGFVLGVHVSGGNVHDSKNFVPIFDQVKEKFPQMKAAVADAGYVTPHIAKHCFDNNVIPVLPYKRPLTKDGFFRKHEYVYDEHFDEYICPKEELLTYSRTDRDGYRLYHSNPSVCKNCDALSQCTQGKENKKTITRHIWTDYLEEANHLRYTHYRGKDKVRDEAMLAFACMNMKKLASWLSKSA